MRRAAIDIGSHSFLLTIVDEWGDVVWDERHVVALGKDVGNDGSLRADRMTRGMNVLRTFLKTCEAHNVGGSAIHACATSAVRRARNGEEWVSDVLGELGLSISIATGAEEASLTFVGSLHGLPAFDGETWAIDIGGGSAEIARGRPGCLSYAVSTPLGAARQAELHLPAVDDAGRVSADGMNSLEANAAIALEALTATPQTTLGPTRCVAVGGTATSLLALHLGHRRYRGASLHGGILSTQAIGGMVQRLLPLNRAERIACIPFAPDRADTLLAGAAILTAIVRTLGHAEVIISTRGLRFGMLVGAKDLDH